MNIQIKEQKEKLKAIVLECYKKSYDRNFTGLNISKLSSESVIKRIKSSISVLDGLDENSQTYKSLISVARKAAEELNKQCYEKWYIILIEHFVTLPEVIKNKKSKSVVFFPDKKIIEVKKEEGIKQIEIIKQKYLPEGITGKKLKKIVAEETDFNNELEEMSFDDEFVIEDDSTEDINDLEL